MRWESREGMDRSAAQAAAQAEPFGKPSVAPGNSSGNKGMAASNSTDDPEQRVPPQEHWGEWRGRFLCFPRGLVGPKEPWG